MLIIMSAQLLKIEFLHRGLLWQVTGYWGVAINLNYGGFANGYGANNNQRSYVPGYSAFTVNTRTSTSQTTYDKRLLTIMPDGNTTCHGNLTVSGNLQSGNTMTIRGTSEWDTATLNLATPFDINSANQFAYKCALIAQGMGTYSRSKLHFCLNNVNDNTYPTQNATLSNSRMTQNATLSNSKIPL